MSSAKDRWTKEYKDVFIRTLKLFFPLDRAKLLVVLDNESKEDHKFGEEIGHQWPYPEICYSDPGDPRTYHFWGKSRMFLDMFYPDECTNLPYIGYVDTDTFFTTLVTPDLLFDNEKPIIIGKIGEEPYPCWPDTTEIFLGLKEVMQCMSTFPLMIKTNHMKEMRERLSENENKHFDLIHWQSTRKKGEKDCICQFSIMCNYIWWNHRDEYSWHLQMWPNGSWNGQNWVPSQVPVDYYFHDIKPEMKVPIPRSSIHLRYRMVQGEYINRQVPEISVQDDFIREGLCYSAGVDYCPEKCRKWSLKGLHRNLFSFEDAEWFWDERCLSQQKKHYENVKKMVNYYVKKKKELFGLDSFNNFCNIL
eukprot:Seg821.4 transcript_id=Seg821.4/GoldUCD/mRNA.D3Y31 product="hypothetical protein" protein_id=Seg821.4/GoldUCD/D3Y31